MVFVFSLGSFFSLGGFCFFSRRVFFSLGRFSVFSRELFFLSGVFFLSPSLGVFFLSRRFCSLSEGFFFSQRVFFFSEGFFSQRFLFLRGCFSLRRCFFFVSQRPIWLKPFSLDNVDEGELHPQCRLIRWERALWGKGEMDAWRESCGCGTVPSMTLNCSHGPSLVGQLYSESCGYVLVSWCTQHSGT